MKNKYPITATFIDEISYDIPSSNWSFDDWKKDIDNMQEVGIDTIVFIRGGLNNRMIYPSKVLKSLKEYDEDLLEFVLSEADRRNMKVFVPLYMTTIDWNCGNAKEEIKKNKIYIDEVLTRYRNHTSFFGWYIPHEVDGLSFNIVNTMGGLIKLCKKVTPEKKILISPFFRTKIYHPNGEYLNPEDTYREWDSIFKNFGKSIDYCAFQDGSAPLMELENYLKCVKKVCDKYHIELWCNVETFERDVRHLYLSVPFEILREKINIAKPYVTKMITFEFSHFLSPQSIFINARNLNKRYKEYYSKK